MTQVGELVSGRYEIEREIGRGGMSVVYLVRDIYQGNRWALKESRRQGQDKIDTVACNGLLTEAEILKRLNHPALPRIVDVIDDWQTLSVVMEYIEGEPLDSVIKQRGPQSEAVVIDWMLQICDALRYLHSQKPRPIIYRDVKPANLILTQDRRIKVIDFGIAREYKKENSSDTMMLGTRGFAPPEQYVGQTDARSDIYALGMTAYYLLTGVDPRTGDTSIPLRERNQKISSTVEYILEKCTQTAAERRYQDCAELMRDLRAHERLLKKEQARVRKEEKVRVSRVQTAEKRVLRENRDLQGSESSDILRRSVRWLCCCWQRGFSSG